MSTTRRLDLLHEGPEKVINVFIHGYRSVKTAHEYAALCAKILAAKPPGQVYCYHWPSTGVRLPATVTILRHAKQLLRLNPAAWGLAALEWIVGKGIKETVGFKTAERQAEKAGKEMLRRVSRVSNAKSFPVNLIGHSLGARVIQFSLMHSDWSKYDLQQCILLGGAADLQAHWGELYEHVNDRIMNVYSKKDVVLRITPDRRKRVGRYPISSPYKGIVNRHYGSFGHWDYWKRLPYLLPRLSPAFKASKSYRTNRLEIDSRIEGILPR